MYVHIHIYVNTKYVKCPTNCIMYTHTRHTHTHRVFIRVYRRLMEYIYKPLGITRNLFVRTGHRDDDGRNSGSNLSKKQRKARTAFTDHQLQTLEKSFERQKYLSVQDRMELAAKLNLSDTQVKTWYQNRR